MLPGWMLFFILIIAMALLLMAATASSHRKHMRRTERKLCGHCATANPPQANYCRNCGTRLTY
ncbi:MAG: hypothetical protein ACFCVE_13930 [Phycisphaerae bacterium]